MKAHVLPRYVAPAPVELQSCASCRTMRPEVYVGAYALCWVCAHAHLEHGAEVGRAWEHRCHCPGTYIYPPDVISARRQRAAHAQTTKRVKP